MWALGHGNRSSHGGGKGVGLRERSERRPGGSGASYSYRATANGSEQMNTPLGVFSIGTALFFRPGRSKPWD